MEKNLQIVLKKISFLADTKFISPRITISLYFEKILLSKNNQKINFHNNGFTFKQNAKNKKN